MTLSIRTKLFFALAGTGVLVALAMLAGLRWSFESGLVELVQGREEARIAAIAGRLAEIYRRDGGWEGLRQDRRLWVQTLFERPGDLETQTGSAPGRPRGPPPGAGLGRWLRGDDRRHQHSDPDGPGAWPPHRALDAQFPQPLHLRLMLLDAGGDPVYGRPLPGDPGRHPGG